MNAVTAQQPPAQPAPATQAPAQTQPVAQALSQPPTEPQPAKSGTFTTEELERMVEETNAVYERLAGTRRAAGTGNRAARG